MKRPGPGFVVTETYYIRKLQAYLKHLEKSNKRIWWMRTVGTPFGKRGIPDFLITIDGRLLGIEMKSLRGQVSTQQFQVLREMAQRGNTTAVCRSDVSAIAIIEKVMNDPDGTRGTFFGDEAKITIAASEAEERARVASHKSEQADRRRDRDHN